MEEIKQQLLAAGFKGDLDDTPASKDFYSHDASLFEIRPQLIVSPKDSADVKLLVRIATDLKSQLPGLSLTARSAGTDMSGGAINDSVIVNFNKYFVAKPKVTDSSAQVKPGVFYRDFEKVTLKHHLLLPPYPASRDLCTLGGMVNNNSGGEKSLQYGKIENFVTGLNVVLADGNEYVLKPLDRQALKKKMSLKNFEGELYRRLFKLLDENYDDIKLAKPNVTKNSTGYNLWDVWDRGSGVFDLTKLFVGAQGTLGFTTDIKLGLVPAPVHSGTLVIFLKDIKRLGKIINKVLTHKPATFEGFDNYTLASVSSSSNNIFCLNSAKSTRMV